MRRKMITSGPVHGQLSETYQDRGPGGGAQRGDSCFGIGGGRMRRDSKHPPSVSGRTGSAPRLRDSKET